MEPIIGDSEAVRVLLVEDDVRLAALVARFLSNSGMIVTAVESGERGLEESNSNVFDAVLLDVMLPGMSGLDVCRAIRERSDVPILMLTALGDVPDRVMGLQLGADDYLSKPFSSPELLARIQAMVRRYRGRSGPSRKATTVGRLSVDPRSLQAWVDGELLDLTAYEFSILRVLAENAGSVLSRERILDLAKGCAEDAFERSIDGHISRLRRKLGDDAGTPRMLKTVRGAGYLLAVDPE